MSNQVNILREEEPAENVGMLRSPKRKRRRGRQTYAQRINKVSVPTNIFFNIIIFGMCLLIALPMLLTVIISFSSSMSISTKGYSFTPNEWSTLAYTTLFRMGKQLRDSYVITIFYSVVFTAGALAVTSMFSFAIAQERLKIRRGLTLYAYFTMLFSSGLAPTYMIYSEVLGLADTIWVILLPGLLSAWYAIILRTFIQTTIPSTLFEAARIDGAGDFRAFFQICLPLLKPGLATIGLFNFVNKWNEWFPGMLYLKNPKLIPLQTLLQRIQNELNFIKNNAEEQSTREGMELLRNLPESSTRMAILVIVTIPVLFAYPFFQRYFIQGLTVGSVKG